MACVRRIHAKNLKETLAMGSEVGGLGFIPPGNEHLAQLRLEQLTRKVTNVVALFEHLAIFARCPACILAKGHAERARLRVAKRKRDVRDRD